MLKKYSPALDNLLQAVEYALIQDERKSAEHLTIALESEDISEVLADLDRAQKKAIKPSNVIKEEASTKRGRPSRKSTSLEQRRKRLRREYAMMGDHDDYDDDTNVDGEEMIDKEIYNDMEEAAVLEKNLISRAKTLRKHRKSLKKKVEEANSKEAASGKDKKSISKRDKRIKKNLSNLND